jgi:hypothetical protein
MFCSKSNSLEIISLNLGISMKVLESFFHLLAKYLMNHMGSLSYAAHRMCKPFSNRINNHISSKTQGSRPNRRAWPCDDPESDGPILNWLGLFGQVFHFSMSATIINLSILRGCQLSKKTSCHFSRCTQFEILEMGNMTLSPRFRMMVILCPGREDSIEWGWITSAVNSWHSFGQHGKRFVSALQNSENACLRLPSLSFC